MFCEPSIIFFLIEVFHFPTCSIFICPEGWYSQSCPPSFEHLSAAKSLQSCPALCDSIDGSPPGTPHPWDSPGKYTGVGCHFLLQCVKVKSETKSLSCVQLLATPWTAAHQAPPCMGFSRQEYCSGVPLPSPGHLSSRGELLTASTFTLPHFAYLAR